MQTLWIFLGGGLGAVARWALSSGITRLAEHGPLHRFPLGILACNLLGCFLVGCAFGFWGSHWHPKWVFPLLVTGFLGGFTTFSTFGRDSHQLFADGLPLLGLANLALSVLLGLAAVWAGIRATS